MQTLTIIHLTILLFLITNIDNIALIFTFSAMPTYKRAIVIGAYTTCMLILLAILLFFSFTSQKLLPTADLRYIGIFPLLFGIVELSQEIYSKFKHKQIEQQAGEPTDDDLKNQFLINLTSQLSVTADSLAVFLPLVLKHKQDGTLVFVFTFLILVTIVSLLCSFLTHFINIKLFKNLSSKIMPWLLLLVGVYVLFF